MERMKSYIQGVRPMGSEDHGPAKAVALDIVVRFRVQPPVYVVKVRQSSVQTQVKVLSKFRFGKILGRLLESRSPRGFHHITPFSF